MALNNITFIKGQGGLSRALPGTDYVSGLVFYDNTLPSGFATNDRIKQIFSVEDAEALGISSNYSDETKATATVTITVSGNTGDNITITTKEGGNNGTKTVSGGTLVDAAYVSVQLVNYNKPATSSSNTDVASDIATLINLGTDTHGYTAIASSSSLTISAKAGLGAFPNTKGLTITKTGSITATSTAWTGGVGSKNAVKHYHISEFFRIQPQGNLFVGIFDVPVGAYTFAEIGSMSTYSSGVIKQLGIYQDSQAFNYNDITVIQSVCDILGNAIAPLSVLLGPDLSAVANLSTLQDLGVLHANNVSVVIGQDSGNLGNSLAWSNGKSVTTLGATLGAVALSKVSEDIAWVSKFNISSGQEDEVIGFANGLPLNDPSISTNLLSLIDLKRYIFLRKLTNVNGSYFNDSHTAIAKSSDYAYIENNRTINKAIRGVYSDLIPQLNSPLTLNSDGTLSDATVAYLTSEGSKSVNQMVRENEVSAVKVSIDPAQNVASTSTIVVAISIVPIGVARNIIVKIGFSTSI
jgi:hypothetical protein